MPQVLKQRRLVTACAMIVLGLVPAAVGVQALAKLSDPTQVPTVTASMGPHHERRVALVVANADYPDAAAPVAGGIEDAQALASRLHARGFDVDFEQNLTRAAMADVVERFVAKVAPGTTALVSFAGFGIQVEHENYLIPTDAHIWREGDVRREGTSVSALLARLAAKGGAVTVAILDASRRNPFERRFRSVSSGLASVEAPRDTLVLSTATPGKTIEDGAGHAIGIITEEIASGDSDAETVFNRTRQRVSMISRGEQVPYVSSSLLDSFSF